MPRTTEEKITELTVAHGPLFKKLVQSKRIPVSQIGNFFGRHSDRRTAILKKMREGVTYSEAYQQSGDCFDTKRWPKISNRAAACRGLILRTAAGVASMGHDKAWSDEDIQQIERLTKEIAADVRKLMRVLVKCEVTENNDRMTKQRKVRLCNVDNFQSAFTRVISSLRTAQTKLRKCVRDVPHMREKVGRLPTTDDVAKTAIESARIIRGIPILMRVINGEAASTAGRQTSSDLYGIGPEYALILKNYLRSGKRAKRIAIHKLPDADALVSAWIAERYTLPNEDCLVEFVPRDFDPDSNHSFDLILDVGRQHDPSRMTFDHKPPAFTHRDEECATSLIWKYTKSKGCSVEHLEELVDLVHDGDATTRRLKSTAYAESRSRGLHAIIKSARNYALSDSMLYQGVAAYLDARF